MPADTNRLHTDWAAHRLLPSCEPPERLDIYDVRDAPFEVMLSVATLTGLINRQQARVYLLSDKDAEPLRELLLGHISTRHHASPAENVLSELIETYHSSVRGLVIYDPAIIDSVNVATTLAGLRDAVVVSPQQAESLSTHRLPVLADLRVYGWKNRLQAYRWAVRNLLRETSPRLVAGMRPTIASGLRSYLVASRAFVYWLDPRLLALPDPSSDWTTERCLMKCILRSFAPGTPHLGWFMNEARGVSMASQAALPMLPSDYFYNMEVWSAGNKEADDPVTDEPGRPRRSPLPYTPDQQEGQSYRVGATLAVALDADAVALVGDAASPEPNGTGTSIPPKIYVSFTMSDGDNLQFNQHRLYHLWQDPARGSVPIGWTISPVLSEAAPELANYYLRTATPHDELIAGASGAGYILPSRWPGGQLSAYLQLTGALMQRMRMEVVEVLDRPTAWNKWSMATASVATTITRSLLPLHRYRSGDARRRHVSHRRHAPHPDHYALSDSFPNWHSEYARVLTTFGLRGILSGDASKQSSWRFVNGVPIIQNLGLTNGVEMALALIKRNTPAQLTQPHFMSVYMHAWTITPSDVKTIAQSLDSRYEVVTPGVLLDMIARSSR